MTDNPKLFIFSGLPGAGKTTLAKELARSIGAVYLRIDSIEQALASSTLKITKAEDAGYKAAFHIAEDNLALGHSVVGDSVNPIELTRSAWRQVAINAKAHPIDILVSCSDVSVRLQRLAKRTDGDKEKLKRLMERDFDPFTQPDITLDTSDLTLEAAKAKLLQLLGLD